MDSLKGITPVVAITLMMLVTVAAAGTLYTLIQDTQEDARENAPEIELNPNTLNVESCWTDGPDGSGNYETSISLRNEASESINNSDIDILVDGREKPHDLDPEGLVEPRQTFIVTFTGLSSEDEIDGDSEIQFFMGSDSVDYRCRK